MRLYPPFNKEVAQKKFRPILNYWNEKNPNIRRGFFVYSRRLKKYVKIYL